MKPQDYEGSYGIIVLEILSTELLHLCGVYPFINSYNHEQTKHECIYSQNNNSQNNIQPKENRSINQPTIIYKYEVAASRREPIMQVASPSGSSYYTGDDGVLRAAREWLVCCCLAEAPFWNLER